MIADVEQDQVTFDLDAARAARREKLGRNPTVRLGGRTWTLSAECPMVVLEAIEQGRASAMRRLVVPDDSDGTPDEFPLESLTVDDVKELLRKVYGLGPT